MTNPAKLMETQVAYWGKTLTHFMEAQQALSHGAFSAPEDDTPDDRRFSRTRCGRRTRISTSSSSSIRSTSAAMEQAVADLDGLEPKDKRRVEFFARQVIDLFAPTNYLATNPDALERAVETDGMSLVQGLENLVHDIEANNGMILPTLADPDAFELGQNIATAEGEVVFRNEMMELIQFAPTTEKVHRTPLVVFPALDQQVLHSRPQAAEFADPMDRRSGLHALCGVLEEPDGGAMPTSGSRIISRRVSGGRSRRARDHRREAGQRGRLLHRGHDAVGDPVVAEASARRSRSNRPPSSPRSPISRNRGEFTPFLDDDFVDAIERQVDGEGILDSTFMTRTFSFLRANDLVYGPAVRSYMLGEAPPAFDLLYWNGDSTNLPGKMAKQYLRGLCQDNKLADGGFDLLGETLSVDRCRCARLCHRLRNRPYRRLEGQLSRRHQDGFAQQDLHPQRVGSYRGHREPAEQEQIRPLHQ